MNRLEGIEQKIDNITNFPIEIIVDGFKINIEENGECEFISNKNTEIVDENIKEKLVFLEHFEKYDCDDVPENKIDTANKKMGNGALYLNSTSIINTNTSEFGFASDFTIDYWLNLDSSNLNNTWSPNLVVPTYGGIWIGLYSGEFVVRGYSTNNYLAVEPPTLNEWVHIAITRKDGIIYLFYDGVLQGQVANTISFPQGNLVIGNDLAGNYTNNSYMDELRILKENAIWTDNFTPNNDEYEENEGIVYHFNYSKEAIEADRGIVADTAQFSTAEKKFGISSKYFNSSYIQYNSSENYKFESDFTIDYWLNLDSSNLNNTWTPNLVVPTYEGIWIGLYSGEFVVRGYSTDNYLAVESPTLNEWVHIAVTRKDGIIYLFYDGVLQGQVANTISFSQGNLVIGSDLESNYTNNSYIDEVRILNGYCQWTENFEVPTKEYEY